MDDNYHQYVYYLNYDKFFNFIEKRVMDKILLIDEFKNKFSNDLRNLKKYNVEFNPFCIFKYSSLSRYIGEYSQENKFIQEDRYCEDLFLLSLINLRFMIFPYHTDFMSEYKNYEDEILSLYDFKYIYDDNLDILDSENECFLLYDGDVDVYGDKYFGLKETINILEKYLDHVYKYCTFNYKLSKNNDDINIIYIYIHEVLAYINDYIYREYTLDREDTINYDEPYNRAFYLEDIIIPEYLSKIESVLKE